MRYIIPLLMSFIAFPLYADEAGLPFIQESVDQIIVINLEGSDHQRLVFIRGDAVLATRLVIDEMVWGIEEGQFTLTWQDYWTAERRITTPSILVTYLKDDPTQEGQNGPWWCMFRNMRDLKQP